MRHGQGDYHLMRHGLLGILPLPAPVDESDKEEWAPEDEVGHSDDQKHLDPGHPLPLHSLDVLLDVAGGWHGGLLQGGQGRGGAHLRDVDHCREQTGNPYLCIHVIN